MNGYLIVFFVIFLILAHLFKMARLYLVLMEQDISFFSFVFLYVRTTLANLVIPFKIGELYRIGAVYHVTGSPEIGILSILTDRFFDTAALLCIILPFELFFTGGVNPVPAVLFLGLFLIFLSYLAFAPSYAWLNRYLIINKRSERSLRLLKWLDVLHEWYGYVRTLLIGRSALITIASLSGWVFEILALKFFAGSTGISFTIRDFNDYINSIFLSGNSRISRPYNIVVTAVFVFLTLVFAALWLRRRFVGQGEIRLKEGRG
ncbi:MAG: flippase-like domain-containing protein [Lachnospiraceae bacterium]|nr:flippase-like domain-containing protein [Lachnospiraceae bacterium]